MKLKTDENLGRSAVELLRAAGHDVETAIEEGLQGASDIRVFRTCFRERRILLTLDRGFGQVLRFRAGKTAGIVILTVPPKFSITTLRERLNDFLRAAEHRSVEGEVWVVEPGRLRIRPTSGGDSS